MSALKSLGRYSFGPSVRLDALAHTRARARALSLSPSHSLSGCSCYCSCRFCCCAFSVMPRLQCWVGGRGHSCREQASERERERERSTRLSLSLMCCRGCQVTAKYRGRGARLKCACGLHCHTHMVTSGLVVVCLVTGCVCGSRASASVRLRGNDPRAAASHLPPGRWRIE